jgi:hypothetical protein
MHWCLGMYASGSTWVFNATMKIAAAIVPQVPVRGLFITTHAELGSLDDNGELAIIKSHDTGFIDDIATLDSIAASFGGGLTVSDRARIFAEMRRPAIETLIARLDSSATTQRHDASGDVVDTATQWHKHHAHRTGEVGRWRHMLTPQQAAAVEQQMQDWMAAFGYRADVAPYKLTIGSMAYLPTVSGSGR